MKILHIIAIAGALLATQGRAAEPIWDGNKVDMAGDKLADGVYAYYASNAKELNARGGAAATSGGLIVGSKGALLVDTMLNSA
jgi:hypothetical protein